MRCDLMWRVFWYATLVSCEIAILTCGTETTPSAQATAVIIRIVNAQDVNVEIRPRLVRLDRLPSVHRFARFRPEIQLWDHGSQVESMPLDVVSTSCTRAAARLCSPPRRPCLHQVKDGSDCASFQD